MARLTGHGCVENNKLVYFSDVQNEMTEETMSSLAAW